ncbi:hypothetical protein L1987_66783 [Smallanthus sonchifolius]|uniref:Uncharacterized protein n=1 Tax=Smallanthus sonchifolius TaxID=185202 RepID=A0ACB9BY31_9ASTR|nr:hypothetical protein L1987_66783 [Smallanthus sonchifolius]
MCTWQEAMVLSISRTSPCLRQWDLMLRDYKEARVYIEDIKDICDDFEGLCQQNLAANTDHGSYVRPGSGSGRFAPVKDRNEMAQADHKSGTVDTWTRDGSPHFDDGVRLNADKWQGDSHQYVNPNIPHQHYDGCPGPPMNAAHIHMFLMVDFQWNHSLTITLRFSLLIQFTNSVKFC